MFQLAKKTVLATAMAATAMVSATPAMAQSRHHHDDNGTAIAVGAGILGIIAIAALSSNHNDRRCDGDRDDDRRCYDNRNYGNGGGYYGGDGYYYGSNGGILGADSTGMCALLDYYHALIGGGGVAAATIVENPFKRMDSALILHSLTDERIGAGAEPGGDVRREAHIIA